MTGKVSKIIMSVVNFLIVSVFFVNAQDINFLQSYNFKEFLNPGFVAFDNCNYLSLRDKQSALQYGGINNVSAGYSGYYPQVNSGLVFSLENEFHPAHIINNLSGRLSYVYNIHLGRSISLIPVVGGRYSQRTYNYSNVIFPGMVGSLGYQGGLDPGSLPSGSVRVLSGDLGFLFVFKHFYLGGIVDNLLVMNFGQPVVLDKQLSIELGYDYFDQLKKYSVFLAVKKTEYGVVSNFNFTWFLNKNISIAPGINGINLESGIAYITGVYTGGRSSWMVSYGVGIGRITMSIFELGVRYKFKCKKSRRNTINCPAYQF